jgi:hypothetical protein
LRLVEAKADYKPSGIIPQGRVPLDPFNAIDVEDIDSAAVVHRQIFVTGHLCTDEPVVVRVASQIGAVAVGDGERVAFRNTLSSDVVGEPIQAETCDDDAAHIPIVGVERQRELNGLSAR